MRGLRTVVTILILLGLTVSSATAPEGGDADGVVDASALQQFWHARASLAGNETIPLELEAWIVGLMPWDELCGRVVEQPWIVGVSDVVRRIPDNSGYWINVPLAAFGAVEYLDDGAPVVSAEQEDKEFTQADLEEYLAVAGIYYNTHGGIGTTSFIQITARPLEDPPLC